MRICGHELFEYVLPVITSNMYIFVATNKALVIDPHINDRALEMLCKSGIKDLSVILTHEHFDHISGVNCLREFAAHHGGICSVYASLECACAIKIPEENLSKYFEALFMNRSNEEQVIIRNIFDSDYFCEADIIIADGYKIIWDNIEIVFKETPGHSPGSICIEFYDAQGNLGALATGDSLVQGNRVITRLPKGSKKNYLKITKPYLESFEDNTIVLPGHGNVSTIGELEIG